MSDALFADKIKSTLAGEIIWSCTKRQALKLWPYYLGAIREAISQKMGRDEVDPTEKLILDWFDAKVSEVFDAQGHRPNR